jgi:type I restriction enzyme S subunit
MRELPKGWRLSSINELFELKYGKGLRTKELTKNGFPVFGANGIIGKYHTYLYNKEKLIMSCRGAASGTVHVTLPKSFVTSNSIVFTRKSERVISKKFAYFFLKGVSRENIVTGTAQPQITIQNLKKVPVILPPIDEQEELVRRVEQLVIREASLHTSLTRLPALLADFREAVISSILPDESFKALGSELEDIRYGTSRKCTAEPKGTPVLRIPNIKNGKVDIQSLKYAEFNDKERSKLALNKEDVLVIRSNGSVSLVGRSAYVNEQNEGLLFAGYLIRLRPKKTLAGKYLSYALSSSKVRAQIVEMAHSSSGVNNINSVQLQSIMLPIPGIEEQLRIVTRIESLFALADHIEAKMETLKRQIEDLPQAILAKAFRGEL